MQRGRTRDSSMRSGGVETSSDPVVGRSCRSEAGLGWAGGSLSGYARPGGTRRRVHGDHCGVVKGHAHPAHRRERSRQPRIGSPPPGLAQDPDLEAAGPHSLMQQVGYQPLGADERRARRGGEDRPRGSLRRTRSRGSGALDKPGRGPASVGTLDNIEGPPNGQPGHPDHQPIHRVRSPSPASRRPSGAPPTVRTNSGQVDQPHGIATPVSKINHSGSMPVPAPRSPSAWTQEQLSGLTDTRRDSPIPGKTKWARKFVRTNLPASHNARCAGSRRPVYRRRQMRSRTR